MTNKVQKVIVLGGSFDPVTNAHLQIIRKLSEKYHRVVVLPCRISPFKQEGCSASGEDRVQMLRRVTADLENVKVSKWEIKREGVSYTVDAVKHYKEKYPDAELYFAIGSDCLAGLPDWKDADVLAKNVTFVLIRRPGFSVSKKVSDGVKALGFRLKPAGFTVSADSSAEARVAAAFGNLAEFVPQAVAEYIGEHGLYTQYASYTQAYATFGLRWERIEHTFRAVQAGIRLAKLHGEDVHETIVALLLHDIGKYASPQVLKREGVRAENYATLAAEAPAVLHAHVSAAVARDYFNLDDRIVHAVEKHTTGSADMCALDKIVYLADAVESGREYEGVESLRRLAAKDLDRAMLRALRLTVKHVKAKGNPLCEETLAARDRFAEICRKKAAAKKAAPVFASPSQPAAQEQHAPIAVPNTDMRNADSQTFAMYAAQKLSEKKGRNVIIIDVAQKTVVAERFVIAGANSTTAVKALADYVDEKFSKECGIEPLRRDVSPKWAVLDYGHVIVHVQHEEAREYYNLQKLWDTGNNVTHIS